MVASAPHAVGLNAALDSAFRLGDANAVAALTTEDVVLSLENVPDWRGREAVRDSLAQFFAGNTVAAFTLAPAESEEYGDVAYERGTFTWISAANGERPVARRSLRYSIVRHRGPDGVWRLHRYIENSTEVAPQ